MSKKKVKKENPKLKLKKFNLELEELLEKYNYIMDLRLQITQKGIVPRLVVDTPENLQQKPQQVVSNVKNDVKTKKTDGKSVGRPEKKGKKDKGKN